MSLQKKLKQNIPQGFIPSILYLGKWILLCAIVGLLSGSASAIFLISLEWATNLREANFWIISMLPLGGLVIGLTYHYFGQNVVKGNNQILEEFHSPKKIIPLKMAPLVLLSTVVTHLFGGSAGREGTAIQMGGAIADQFTKIFKLKPEDRKILLVTGVSAGFASIFGTPLAGAIFALEVFVVGRMRYDAIIPSFLAAVFANEAAHLWPIHHTHYAIATVPDLWAPELLWAILAGICFGIGGMLFSNATHFWGNFFKKTIKYPPLRPVIGGIVLAAAIWVIGTTRWIGLGVPVIVEAFEQELPFTDFALKILFTSFTLGAGFKGGEVTPLFFTGATLGSALSLFIPLPVALLAGMGFVAVFAGATNTPIACTLMGIELFGAEAGVFIGIACATAYLFSGHTGIYGEQIIGSPKNFLFGAHKGKKLNQL
ncbi:voltage-gated chloride channel family protein [Plebeiibacterium marinum]|uniref:Voltage-gated chloride channel family protein n=1 Tax=Plebeiibacterium marinum TaxID=2992111 RepID=A0AAE3SMW8_9BACT|nr:voltage-gated chloride channel family protein [Plebeiobacterium marinum]MCW3807970.1 voltage-gated chloride channel family protein [Plebeiobacterium marinum]